MVLQKPNHRFRDTGIILVMMAIVAVVITAVIFAVLLSAINGMDFSNLNVLNHGSFK